ncbi:MAG: TetR/AcrR family transcriptional regulator [Saprospiraceae bacterium]|nr:TetR/AcrR family transcriptional regulator [Saprospiraceae bacterium]
MNLQFSIQPNEKLALRNPESTELGRKIVREGLLLIQELGYEHFTFKKLAENIQTTEASIYRYFENKHRLLLYFLTWYWNLLEFTVVTSIQNMTDPALKIGKVIDILTSPLPEIAEAAGMNKTALQSVAIAESSKVYLIKEVDDINRERLFKPYKDLCGRIASLFSEFNPAYPYPRSLASTLVEMSQFQPYFKEHLPALTDFTEPKEGKQIADYLNHLVFSSLK